MIKEIDFQEINQVTGGGKGAEAAGYGMGWLVGGAIRSLNNFGTWLGGATYDALHKHP